MLQDHWSGKDLTRIEEQEGDAKLSRLHNLLQGQGFFQDPDKQLLLFTEFKDTLDYPVEKLSAWGLRVGFIHGGMNPGSRNDPRTRLFAEQRFREGVIQALAAAEAAGGR